MNFQKRYPPPTRFCEPRQRLKIFVTFQGVTKTLSQWAKELGFHHGTLYCRYKYGWTTEEMLTTKPMTREETGYVPRRRTSLYKNLLVPGCETVREQV